MLTSAPNSLRATEGRLVTWHTPDEMAEGWPVIKQMYPTMTEETYLERLSQAKGMNYRQFAYITNEGDCIGVIGLWLFPRVWCGLQGDIDNVVIDSASRSQGLGKLLLDKAIAVAKADGADIMTLDTFVENPESHRFYFREGFAIRGYHFVRPLKGQSVW